jgi:hypothetical protein
MRGEHFRLWGEVSAVARSLSPRYQQVVHRSNGTDMS